MPAPGSSCGITSYDIAGRRESVRYPCATVPPNGVCAAISGSTWMKLWSSVVSAKAWIFSCGTSIHDDGPNSAPTSITLMGERLRRLLDGLVGLAVGVRSAARHERRPDSLRDRLLRDHALRHVPPRRQLEHHVQQGA